MLKNIKSMISPYYKKAQEYWLTLEKREQLLLSALGTFLIVVVFFYLISWVYSLNNDLAKNVQDDKIVLAQTTDMVKRYKLIQSTTSIDFSSVKIDQIKLDMTQILDVKDPNVILQDGVLSFNLHDTYASKYFNLLQKFKNSYGIYPDIVQINRGSQPGLIDVNTSFVVNQ